MASGIPSSRRQISPIVVAEREPTIDRQCALDEQIHGRVLGGSRRAQPDALPIRWDRQRREPAGPLAGNPQRFPARREDPRVGAAPQQRVSEGGNLDDDVLAISRTRTSDFCLRYASNVSSSGRLGDSWTESARATAARR